MLSQCLKIPTSLPVITEKYQGRYQVYVNDDDDDDADDDDDDDEFY